MTCDLRSHETAGTIDRVPHTHRYQLTNDLQRPFRGPAQRPALIHDAPGQAEPPGRSQHGVSVGHEDLRVEI